MTEIVMEIKSWAKILEKHIDPQTDWLAQTVGRQKFSPQ